MILALGTSRPVRAAAVATAVAFAVLAVAPRVASASLDDDTRGVLYTALVYAGVAATAGIGVLVGQAVRRLVSHKRAARRRASAAAYARLMDDVVGTAPPVALPPDPPGAPAPALPSTPPAAPAPWTWTTRGAGLLAPLQRPIVALPPLSAH